VRERTLAEAWGGARGQREIWPTPQQELLLRATLLADARALRAFSQIRERLRAPGANGASEQLAPTLDGAVHALLPALYRNLLQLGVEDPLLAALKSAHQSTWVNNQRLIRRVLPAMVALEQGGAPTLLIKGAALIARGHFDSGLRTITDVDVVVPTGQLSQAIDALMEAGFRPVGAVPAWYVRDYAGRFVPSHAFADRGNAQIDLHWHVMDASCQPDADEDFWAQATPVQLAGVSSAALCATDELLLAILHGLRWSETPTYRWVLDGAQLARGEHGPIDFDRLLAQARRRRVTAAVRAGLAYLRRVADAPIPPQTLRDLRGAPLLERLELRALLTDPRARGKRARALLYHQQHLRRALPLGARPTLRTHVRLAREQLGLTRWRELGSALKGGTPGPGRPPSTVAASLGTGELDASAPPVRLEQPLALGDPEVALRYVRYGAWLPEADGCWTAGTQACVSLPLEERASGALLLGVWGDGYLPAEHRTQRQRVRLSVNGTPVGAVQLDRHQPELDGEAFAIPRSSLAQGERIELVLDTPDAVSPAELGLAPDDRLLGVSIRQLVLSPALRYQPGERLRFGQRSGDERMLAGGWSSAEENGRWTVGTCSSILVSVCDRRGSLDVELHATPFLDRERRKLEVALLANGRKIGALRYLRPADPADSRRLPLPGDAIDPSGELLLTISVSRPSSPFEQGISEDRRPLGLFVRELALVPRADAGVL
jgi:hypothetical protein